MQFTVELSFQNNEKKKRAAELLIANIELAFQNHEKEKRAAELVLATKELIHQNEVKANMAIELLKTNAKLLFQIEEVNKRTEEIVDLKDELIFNEKQLFEKTLISIGDAVISTDVQGKILILNTIAEKLTGWKIEEARGKAFYEVFSIVNDKTRTRDHDILQHVFESKCIQNIPNHTILIAKDGSELLIEDSAAPIINKAGHVIGMVIVFRDYTEKWERLQNIEYSNFHDDLTGLYNRRFFEEELKRLDTQRNYPLMILMGDINGLKLINDSFGHQIGDQFLVFAAKALKEGCRTDDIIARIGGDEFVVLMPKTSAHETTKIIERIQANLRIYKIHELEISLSFGFKAKTSSDQNMLEVMKNADDEMYKNKLFESSSIKNKTIELISETLFEKNGREGIHSKRVSALAVLLAKKLDFGLTHVNLIRVEGLMHDIGKIGIAEGILNKESALTEIEYKEIKRHPEVGYRILSSVNEYSDIATCILQHHEHWDGSGYPQGLKGETIGLDARIIAICDAYDAMTSARSYRNAVSMEEAIKELVRCSGTHFDPTLIPIFISEIIKAGEQKI